MKKITVLSIGLLLGSAAFLGYISYLEQIKENNQAPVISAESDTIELLCDYSEMDLLQGISAEDAEDGPLTDEVIAGAPSRFITKGESVVEYVVFDSENQPGTFERKVIFSDYKSPQILLDTPLVFNMDEAYFDLIYGSIHVTDRLDGDITDWIQFIDSDVNYGTKGSYTFEVSATNSFGDTVDAALPVHLQDQTSLTYELVLSESIITAESVEEVNPAEYLKTVTDRSGKEISDLGNQVEAEIENTANENICEIHYSLMKDGALAGETWLTVILE